MQFAFRSVWCVFVVAVSAMAAYAEIEFEGRTWNPLVGDTAISVSDGWLDVEGTYCCPLAWTDTDLSDVSVRSRVFLEEGISIGAAVRRDRAGDPIGYHTLLNEEGRIVIGISGPATTLGTAETDFNPKEEELWMQIDAIEDLISVYVWDVGDPFPTEPVLEVEDDTIQRSGEVAVGILANLSWPGPDPEEPGTGAFRSIQISDKHIYVHGDFDTNNLIDATDIDLLSVQVQSENNDMRYDLTGDRVVNADDRNAWVRDIKNTWFGDSNLDGQFNSSDFVAVFQAGEYEDEFEKNSTWATGDWNGDAEFNSTDFVVAFAGLGYEQGARENSHAVPEPAFVMLGLTSLIAVLLYRQR